MPNASTDECAATEPIYQQAMRLSTDARAILAHRLWDSIEAEVDDAPLTAAQREDLRRRLEHARRNPGRGRPIEEALDELRARLKRT